MAKAIISRPLDGITINTEREYLRDEHGKIRIFDCVEDAMSFQAETDPYGTSPYKTITASCGPCCKCGGPLFISHMPGRTFKCFGCGGDFTMDEQKDAGLDARLLTPGQLAGMAACHRDKWRNRYAQELCKRAGLLEEYTQATGPEAADVVRRAAGSLGITDLA